jgi:aminoglycoside phosphotransferase (APT) family kinase protein
VRDRVPVPELLWADSSGTSSERPYAVMTWVEGAPLTAALQDAPAAVGRAVGETLAAIGTHTFPQAGFFTPDLTVRDRPEGKRLPFLEDAEHWLDGGAAAQLGEPLATEVRAFLRRHAAYLPAESRPAALVHGDYHDGNLLLRRTDDRWQVVAVLDWEFAFAGPPVLDLSILLRWADRWPPAFEQGVVAGFTAAGGVLPAEWKRISRLLDLVMLLAFLRAPGADDDAVLREVVSLIGRTMRAWETYA